MNIGGLDLNLLRVFDAVYRERNATRGSRRLGLSQPAVSNALSRLRAQIGDPLFHRAPEGLRPTAKADALAEPVRAVLALLEEAVEGPGFHPETTRRVFRLSTLDYGSIVLLPRIAARLAREAPRARLLVEAAIGRTLDRMDEGEVVLGLLIRDAPPERFYREPLLRDRYVVLMRKENPLAATELTLQRFLDALHLLASPSGDLRGVIDERLARLGASRRVAMSVGQFAIAPAVLESTDMVLSCPRRLADHLSLGRALVRRPLPAPIPPSTGGPVSMIWRRRLGESPATDWLREVVREEARAVLRAEAESDESLD